MSGSLAKGLAGGGAAALAILGLAGMFPPLLAAVATVAVGVAMLFEGAAVTARFSSSLTRPGEFLTENLELASGMTAEFLGGVVGMSLGLLALLGVNPTVLVPVAALIYGGALVMGSGVTARLNQLVIGQSMPEGMAREVANEAVAAAAGVQTLVGLGAITLGILALVGIVPLTLSLVSMLGVGLVDFLSGTAVGGRMLGAFRHQ